MSIVLPTHRVGPFLGQTIDSVVAQSLREWELILVGDGLPDPQLLDAFVQIDPDRIHTIHTPKRGVSAARNVGTDKARGEFIVYLDDDDLWESCRLKLQIERLRDMPDAVACYSRGVVIDAAGEIVDTAWPAVVDSHTLVRDPYNAPRITTLMIRREVAVAIGGFHPSFKIGQDNEFILRLIVAGRLVGLDERLVLYRRHTTNASMTSTLEDRRRADLRAVELQVWGAEARHDRNLASELGANRRAVARRTAELFTTAAMALIRNGQLGTAARLLGAALRDAPSVAIATFVRGGACKTAALVAARLRR